MPPRRPDLPPERTRRAVAPCPEIDCVRHRLPPRAVAVAEWRAAAFGVGADEALIAAGQITPEAYCRALAGGLGLRFVDLDRVARSACPISPSLLVRASGGGLVPLSTADGLCWVMAPRGLAARHLVAQAGAHPELRRRLLVTTPEHLRRFILRHESAALGWLTSQWLRSQRPMYSAAAGGALVPAAIVAAVLALLAAATAIAPGPTVAVVQAAISAVFLAWAAFRILMLPRPPEPEPPPLADAELPAYTVVAALYREAAAVGDLVQALRGLDYPAEKLSVMLVLEDDDRETPAALARLGLGPSFEVIVAPPDAPRTKPKALNVALPFVKGELLAVYDAEDRPEGDQLRRAAAAFAADRRGRLACVQARLTVDNTDDSWLTKLFTAEYAGLFDALLPSLAARRLPIPLGGSSNHFRLDVLREAGGWDPHNVTEDADLGTRLARLGYRTGVIGSSTYEEQPAAAMPWLRQRTRWFKGWIQTWCVHMREPARLVYELGPAGFAAFQLMCIGTVAAALLQPVAWILILGALIGGGWFAEATGWSSPVLTATHWAALGSGYAVSLVLAAIGLARRGLLRIAWLLPLMLVHWALLSVAAWRAVFQLLHDPYGWEKTEHGLGRSSRRVRNSA